MQSIAESPIRTISDQLTIGTGNPRSDLNLSGIPNNLNPEEELKYKDNDISQSITDVLTKMKQGTGVSKKLIIGRGGVISNIA